MPVKWDRTYVDKTLRPQLVKAFTDYSKEMNRRVKRSLSSPYPPASRPGSPPHRRTGRLRGSIRSIVLSTRQAVISQTGSDLDYSTFLEFGTSIMAQRPYLRPALRATTPFLKRRLRQLRLPGVSLGFSTAPVRR